MSVKVINNDGVARIAEIGFRSMQIQTPNIFPSVRSLRPNEMDILIGTKGRYPLEHVEGCVVKLTDAPRLLYPRLDRVVNQQAIDGGSLRDPFSEFRSRALILPDPSMQYLYYYRKKYDTKFKNALGHIARIKEFFEQFEKNLQQLQDKSNAQKIRRAMHNDLWFSKNRSDVRARDAMLGEIMKIIVTRFDYGVSVCPMIKTVEEFDAAKDINEKCQAIAYHADKECASYFLFHKNALKNQEIMSRYFDYIRNNKWATLNIVNFDELDLHCPPDYRARTAFKNFKEEIADIKENYPKKAFMLLQAGNQWFISLEVFDVISSSMTGFDKDIDYGQNKLGYWFDEVKMLPRPIEDAPSLIQREHCPVCNRVTPSDFQDDMINTYRRQHRVFDMDKRANEFCYNIRAKNVGTYMRARLTPSEFSAFQDWILSP